MLALYILKSDNDRDESARTAREFYFELIQFHVCVYFSTRFVFFTRERVRFILVMRLACMVLLLRESLLLDGQQLDVFAVRSSK